MNSRCLAFLSFLLLSFSLAQAQTDILEPPTTAESEEKGAAWAHLPATVSGEGELKIEDSSASVDLVVEGNISCDVSVSAPADASNEVETESEESSSDIEAKSDVGDMEVTNCSSHGVAIGEALSLIGAKVKVEIEELRTNAAGDLVFSEYEAEGKVASGENPRVELELENGTIAVFASLCPCFSAADLARIFSLGTFTCEINQGGLSKVIRGPNFSSASIKYSIDRTDAKCALSDTTVTPHTVKNVAAGRDGVPLEHLESCFDSLDAYCGF